MTTFISEWEKEFDEKFVRDMGADIEPVFIDLVGSVGPIKQFIRTHGENEYKRGVRDGILAKEGS